MRLRAHVSHNASIKESHKQLPAIELSIRLCTLSNLLHHVLNGTFRAFQNHMLGVRVSPKPFAGEQAGNRMVRRIPWLRRDQQAASQEVVSIFSTDSSLILEGLGELLFEGGCDACSPSTLGVASVYEDRACGSIGEEIACVEGDLRGVGARRHQCLFWCPGAGK